jgi:uncharacterized DUF497 family protein
VKRISWNPEKNEWLKETRGVSFGQVADILEQNEEVDVIDHPNQKKYPGQEIYIIKINDYIYLVPAIETDTEIFLKTVIPSRKATAKYLR